MTLPKVWPQSEHFTILIHIFLRQIFMLEQSSSQSQLALKVESISTLKKNNQEWKYKQEVNSYRSKMPQITVKWFLNHNHVLPGDGPIYVSILVLLAIACVFTIAGGLTAVIWTDFIQAKAPCFHDKDGSNLDEVSTFSPALIFLFSDDLDDHWSSCSLNPSFHPRRYRRLWTTGKIYQTKLKWR